MSIRSLDALVAEKVMGFRRIEKPCPCGNSDKAHSWQSAQQEEPGCAVPSYSTDIAAAWMVVEKMLPFYHFGLTEAGEGFFVCSFDEITPTGYKATKLIDAPKAPMAICLAALKAVGVEAP